MDLMDLASERVKILYEGNWARNQLEIEINDSYAPRLTEEMKKVAQERFDARKAKNPKLFDGDAYHLDLKRSIIKPNKLILAAGKMKYSIYDIARKEYAEKYGWKELPTGIGTAVVIVASDSKIVMHNRNSQVDHKAKIGIIGGIYSGGHPFQFMKNEIDEELGFRPRKISLIGIYTRLDERVNHGLIFLSKSSLSSKKILEKENGVIKKEGDVFFLEKNAEDVRDHLKTNCQNILSDSFVGLVIAGRRWWGNDWSKI